MSEGECPGPSPPRATGASVSGRMTSGSARSPGITWGAGGLTTYTRCHLAHWSCAAPPPGGSWGHLPNKPLAFGSQDQGQLLAERDIRPNLRQRGPSGIHQGLPSPPHSWVWPPDALEAGVPPSHVLHPLPPGARRGATRLTVEPKCRRQSHRPSGSKTVPNRTTLPLHRPSSE